MKMYMPLVASEDGIVQLIKQPGVSLEPGDILGILTLDDPARVKHAKPFEGLLPPMGSPGRNWEQASSTAQPLSRGLERYSGRLRQSIGHEHYLERPHPDSPQSPTSILGS